MPGSSKNPQREADAGPRGTDVAAGGVSGVLAALGAYGLWGMFPLLFRMLDGVSPPVIVAHRVLWSLVFVGIILRWNGRMGEVAAALKDGRTLRNIALSAAILALNWLVFIWAVETERVVEVSLGYFINPLVNVALGMVLLGERQNRWQWLAIGLAIIAMAVQTIGMGAVPVISLTLAISFGFYGYLRKTVPVVSAPGLFVETLLMTPVALGYLVYVFVVLGPGYLMDPGLLVLLVLTGPFTAGALLIFAFAARRLRLTTLGMFQYIAPSMHFVIAVWIFREPLNTIQLVSFVLIWISIGVYTFDSIRSGREQRERSNG